MKHHHLLASLGVAFVGLVALTGAVPITYDQRQDGELNVRADLKNFVVIALVPKLNSVVGNDQASDLLDALSHTLANSKKGLSKNLAKRRQGEDDHAIDQPAEDAKAVEEPAPAGHFVKPKTTYQVDISEQAKSGAVVVAQPRPKSVAEEPKEEEPVGEVVVAQV